MPMPKSTKPRERNWIQCDIGEFRTAIASMRASKITVTEFCDDHQAIYSDERGNILARHYQYKRAEQCLVAISMRSHFPERHFVNKTEGSIYV